MTTAIHDHGPLRALRTLIFFGALLALLFVAVEMALVPVVNRLLDKANDEYAVSIEDLDLKPWRGAWGVDGLVVRLRAQPDGEPLLEVKHIDAAIDGHALLRGAFVGAIDIHAPIARFAAEKRGGHEDVSGVDMSVATLLRDMLPMSINRLSIDNGEVYIVTDVELPSGTSRQLDLRITRVNLQAENLTNSERVSESLFGTVTASAKTEGYGDLRGHMRLDPTAKKPTFDLDAAVLGLPLTALNDWSLALGRFSFGGGTLDIYTEVAAKDGRFRGSVKPLAKDVAVVPMHKDLGSKMVAGLVEGTARMLANPQSERVGPRLPFSGDLSGVEIAGIDIDVITAVITALRTAILEALRPIVDGTLSLQDVE